jgi:hypothetical protein
VAGSLYRSGMCVNSLGNGKWGQCNKNYYGNSVLNGFPCVWDRSEDANACATPAAGASSHARELISSAACANGRAADLIPLGRNFSPSVPIVDILRSTQG